ncbi:glutamine synthetase [Galendromus occidentalis]|uniref:glutamine synthetase n=1 Tax=Galendromus occidentalis TaxID=34638 RepID=A0AAJ6QT74_9ACAR|nr:glutamine synthetase [Galendromus occidentalis]
MDHLRLQQAFDRYLDLAPDGKKTVATYIFVDLMNNVCAKARTLDFEPKSLEEYPLWTFGVGDDLENSDATLTPVAVFKDPFLRGRSKLVVCDTSRNGKPFGPNGRAACKAAIDRCADKKIMFGMEQEYTILDHDGHPYRWPKYGQPKIPAETAYYICGVGIDRARGRALSDAHYLACLYAGIEITGTNSEGTPSQWEYQIGPCEGVSIGDHMLAARYVLWRCSEDFDVLVTFDPRPIDGPWTGTGCHVNVSTEEMRSEGGMTHIMEAIKKLSLKTAEHLAAYDPNGGKDNLRRLDAAMFCPNVKDFSWGVASRSAAIRIPRLVSDKGCGYFEDRRPSSNCNPYMVAHRMTATICLDE